MTSVETARPGTEMRVLVLQAKGWGAPASEDVRTNAQRLAAWTDAQIAAQPADLVVLPELSTTPYFCCRKDDRYFDWAEPIPGPSTELFSEVASRHRTTIVVPLFERDDERHYNAAAVIGPDGELIRGEGFGTAVSHYRKCHVPSVENPPDTEAWE